MIGYAEIDKHCEKKGIGSVLRHYAGNRISTNNTLEDMQKYDVMQVNSLVHTLENSF